jgi:hypothetical protein
MLHAWKGLHPRLAGGGDYLLFNLWSLLPGLTAMIVLAVLRQSMFLADTCPKGGGLQGNPLFCQNGTVVATMLDHTLRDISASLASPAPAQPAQTLLRDATDAETEANDSKAVADAAVAGAKAVVDLPDLDAAAKQAALDDLHRKVADQTKAATDAALLHREREMRHAAAVRLTQTHAAIFREARARLMWIGSFGAVVAFSIATVFAASWIWVMAVDDHLNPEAPPEANARMLHLRRWRGVRGLAVLLPISTTGLCLLWALFYMLLANTIFSGIKVPPPFSAPVLHFEDAITTFLFGQISGVPGTFLARGLGLVSHASELVLLAVTALGVAVCATLYQTPWQVQDWKDSLPNAPQPNPPATVPQSGYERFLIRCFQRLNVCIYIGATLLVICVIHVSTQYGWVAALLDPTASDEPWKTAIPNAINAFADEMAFQYGLAFSTVLASLFLPSWVILRRRAWVVARQQNLNDPTNKGVQTWLESRGMGFSNFTKYTQVLALLAPAGAGVFVSILKVITGAGGN